MRTLCVLLSVFGGLVVAVARAEQPRLPKRGVCAHRGASHTHPENTLAAIREAVRLGAHQIEIDVQQTRDGHLVLMHDSTVARTTNINSVFPNRALSEVSRLTLAELQQLDAGIWKSADFEGEKVPTLAEAFTVIPLGIWVNLDIKDDRGAATDVAREVVRLNRQPQTILSVRGQGVAGARKVAAEANQKLLLNNMNRQKQLDDYVARTIEGGFDFIQLFKQMPTESALRRLQDANVCVNYFPAENAEDVRKLLVMGVNFPLVDDVAMGLSVCHDLGIPTPQTAPAQLD